MSFVDLSEVTSQKEQQMTRRRRLPRGMYQAYSNCFKIRNRKLLRYMKDTSKDTSKDTLKDTFKDTSKDREKVTSRHTSRHVSKNTLKHRNIQH